MFKKILLGCFILVVVIAAAIGVLFWYASGEFKPLIAGVMQHYNNDAFDKIYDEASFEFRQQVSKDQFLGVMTALKSVMGPFQELGSITGASRKSDTNVALARVELGMSFRNGETHGSFNFIKNEGQWKLEGLEINIPEPLRGKLSEAPAAQEPAAADPAPAADPAAQPAPEATAVTGDIPAEASTPAAPN